MSSVWGQAMEATNFLSFPDNGQNLTTVSFILASSTLQITTDVNILKLCILKPCLILFYPLLDPMEDLLNVGKAPQSYWLWGVLGCAAWDTTSHPFKKKKLWSFSFRELLLSNKCLLLPSFEIIYESLRFCLWQKLFNNQFQNTVNSFCVCLSWRLSLWVEVPTSALVVEKTSNSTK